MWLLLVSSLPSVIVPLACRRAPTPVLNAAAAPVDDWGGLPGAIKSSKCGAINYQIINAQSTDVVLGLVVDNFQTLNGVNVATAMHNVAKLTKFKRAERDALLRDPRYLQLLDGTVERVSECNARAVADILWSCGTLGELPPTLLKPVLTQVNACLEKGTFEPQHLGIMVWAFSTLKCKPTKLLEQIEDRALEQLSGFNTQNCANILQGFAKLNYPAAKLCPAITDALLKNNLVDGCKPVEVADLTYALAMLGDQQPTTPPPLLTRLSGRARSKTDLASFSSRQLVTMVWAYAKLGLTPEPEVLAEWVGQVRAAHEAKPLLAADVRNLERALQALGEESSWLHPEDPEEEVEESEVEKIRKKLDDAANA